MTTEGTSRTPTLAELLRVSAENYARDLWTAIPGKITKYDSEKQMAEVKPLVQDLTPTEDGDEIAEPLPVIPNVPVRMPRAGGFYITLPVAVGDFCLLIFCSRSIDKYLEGTGNDVDPGDFRMHDLTDAVAFVGVGPTSVALKEDGIDTNLVLGKEGGVSVHLKGDGTIHLGSKDASDALALASKTKAELDKLQGNYDAHTHAYLPGPGAPTPTAVPIPLNGPVAAIASTVVLAD